MIVTLSRPDAIAAMRAGAEAALAGLEHTTCPHSPAGDPNSRVLAAAWVRGWLRASGRID